MTLNSPNAGSEGRVLRTKDLTALAGTTPRTLRHYHQIGLLPEVARDANGYRRYSAGDLVRLLRIRQLAASGLPLREVADALQRGPESYREILAELDSNLAEQAERIASQRRLLAELQQVTTAPEWLADSAPTASKRFDQDVWTLLNATGALDQTTATAIQDALGTDRLRRSAAEWHAAFEALSSVTHIDDAEAERLAAQMAAFADAAIEATGITPATEEQPLMALVDQLQSETFSAAQQQVWNRFFEMADARWPAPR